MSQCDSKCSWHQMRGLMQLIVGGQEVQRWDQQHPGALGSGPKSTHGPWSVGFPFGTEPWLIEQVGGKTTERFLG